MSVMRRRYAAVVIALCAAIFPRTTLFHPVVIGRLLRNIFTGAHPPPLDPVHAACTELDLVSSVAVVISVKDTCTQAGDVLAHLATMLPLAMQVVYVYPNFLGCNRVSITSVFHNLTVIASNATSSPIDGFLLARAHLTTPYALLMHNDAYPMESPAICELYRALQSHPTHAFTVPQLYERAENGLTVPHGHHRNLHLRHWMGGFRIAYDIDFDLLSRRLPRDFKGETVQPDFMEDHAYLGRVDDFHQYIDGKASFTLEYIDSVLSMRMNGTSPWYVPTARFLFNVDAGSIKWQDVPYFVHKRSEETGLAVRAYLNSKWGVEFPNTGIWHYLRDVMLSNVSLHGTELPGDTEGQAALFYSWFHSIGFNRYGNRTLVDVLHGTMPRGMLKIVRDAYVPTCEASATPPNLSNILPINRRRRIINITLSEDSIPISIRVSHNCSPSACGMLVVRANVCDCYTYVSPFRVQNYYGLRAVMDAMKLPSRILRFVQMKYTRTDDYDGTLSCNASSSCEVLVQTFDEHSQLKKWAWF